MQKHTLRLAAGAYCIGLWLFAPMALADSSPLSADVPLIVAPNQADAWNAVISLPLPAEAAKELYASGSAPSFELAGKEAVARPIGWWERGQVPRRVLVSLAGDKPIGTAPKLTVTSSAATPAPGTSPWTVSRRAFKTNDWTGYKVVLRGGSNAESFSRYDDLVLGYGGKEITLRFGTRRDKFHDSSAFAGAHDWWQWIALDTLLESPELTLVRAGGFLYNEDTFLFADVYLELFGNGVARIYAHFVNTRVIGDGWEYFGIPVIGIGAGSAHADMDLDGSETRFALGTAALDVAESAEFVSEKHPGRLYAHEGLTVYQPYQDQRVTDKVRTFGKEFVVDIGDATMLRGLARTVRFTLSLSNAPPKVARLLAPSWLYAISGELWPGENLPVEWRFAQTSHQIAASIARPDPRYDGTFEAGYSDQASEGQGGSALIFSAMFSEDPYHLARGLSYAYCWADIMTDHVDWSVRQPFTGYYWKTITYNKFNDIIWAYLETGDPYLLETAEHVANGYYAQFRAVWPTRSIGRGTWPTSGLVMLYEYTRRPYYLENALDIVHKSLATFDDPNELPGHQMGVGPNGIGNYNEPDGRGFADLVLVRTAVETLLQESDVLPAEERQATLDKAARVLEIALDGIRYKKENLSEAKFIDWFYYETNVMIITMLPLAQALGRPDLAAELEEWMALAEDFLKGPRSGRPQYAIIGRPYYDAATLGARWENGALVIHPDWLPVQEAAGETAVVRTPAGVVKLKISKAADGSVRIKPKGKAPCPVRIE